jgi:hypothetical protein
MSYTFGTDAYKTSAALFRSLGVIRDIELKALAKVKRQLKKALRQAGQSPP